MGSGDEEGAVRRTLRAAAAGMVVLAAVSACRQALGTVFDLPPPRAEPKSPAPAAPANGPTSGASAGATVAPTSPAPDTVRPEIERFLHPDSARARLPRDHAGNIDWVRALRDSIIRPRVALPGTPVVPESDFKFAFDFWYKGPDTTFDARFPHSTHTEWVACQQCHPRIFPYRNTPVTMGDVFQGKYCGECHGKVSYPVLSGCERCHVRLEQPPNRAQPEFLGSIQLARFPTDSGNAAGVAVDSLPRATFPHWLHRIRYRCKVCHMAVFEPRNGANRVTMQDISAGRACGLCHNGETAFRSGFGECDRCHIPVSAPAPVPPPAPTAASPGS